MAVYQYRIDPDSELASVLRPGKKYTIRLAGKDLGVKWSAYGDNNQLPNNDRFTTMVSETAKLVNSKPSAGQTSFTVVAELPRPPKVEAHMRLCRNEESADDADGVSALVISVWNTRHAARSAFWSRGGPFQPEEPETSRPRIIEASAAAAASASASISGLLIVDAATGDVVRGAEKPPACDGLTDSNVDHRPKLETLVTLTAGQPLVRRVDINRLLDGVPDGTHRIQMQPRGVWWCVGSCVEIADEGDGRVPGRLCQTQIPPLGLGAEDIVEAQIENGKIKN
ncbi:hypothetical protein Hte_003083 [Hypoxylon texense]